MEVIVANNQNADEEQLPKYRAPALDKGLDILELLSSTPEPLTATTIVKRLGRSTGELFRMLQVLEYRGYIERPAGGEGYKLTSKLFGLGMIQPPVKGLVEIALPYMRELARETGQSCHLAMHSQGDIVVVARMESNAELGFSVRVGYRRAMPRTTSGLVLYAFQDDATRSRWDSFFSEVPADETDQFRKRADSVRAIGHVQSPSSYVAGVTDLSSPILRGEFAAAALTIPYVHVQTSHFSKEEVLVALGKTADMISAELPFSDARI